LGRSSRDGRSPSAARRSMGNFVVVPNWNRGKVAVRFSIGTALVPIPVGGRSKPLLRRKWFLCRRYSWGKFPTKARACAANQRFS
jgi:hypothetical protein